MKYIALAGAIAFALTSGVCEAEEAVKSNDSASQAKNVSQGPSKSGFPIHFNDDDDTPVTRVGVMSDGQSYDDNTGMPDMVRSDSDMDLQ